LRGNKGSGDPAGGDRRRALVLIAYRKIAAQGFEGLRIREVAAEAGINNATLHHYFPTKEDLIQGVVDFLRQEFQTGRAPRPEPGDLPPLEELRYEFEDTRHRLREAPEMYVVLAELYARSRRNPAIARACETLEAHWRAHLVGILDRGVQARVFRTDLDRVAAAAAIMVQMKGIAYHATFGRPARGEVDGVVSQLAAQTERWLGAGSQNTGKG
jgi:TetR/AcrR family transcriptional regulator, regulator of cefoperazone and chloramphenicol sensitivity